MKKSILIGLIAGITGLAIGYKVPKDKNVGYVMISGRITNLEQAGKYFAEVNDVVCLLYTSPSPRDLARSRMPSSA